MALTTLVALALSSSAQTHHAYKYFRAGNPADAAHASPRAGYALMGGGEDLDEAFQWLCDRAGGGDFLVLRATGTDAYNPYIRKLCPKLNSVATLVIPNREAAADPFVEKTIRHASALFISGGDQANYINFWMGTPVQSALNDAIQRGIPLGGTSAGLAVMGEWAYSAQGDKPDDPNLSGELALSDPLGPRITLVHGFLHIPPLMGAITDTHFAKRDRMGRLLLFLDRLNQPTQTNEPDGKSLRSPGRGTCGIGVEQETAVLLKPDGAARVIGRGNSYFICPGTRYEGLVVPEPSGILALHFVTFGPFDVQRVAPGHAFNLKTWSGDSTHYTLTVKSRQILSSQPGGSVY